MEYMPGVSENDLNQARCATAQLKAWLYWKEIRDGFDKYEHF